MEYVEARALKSSFLSELAMKSTQQGFFDDFMDGNGMNGCSYDDFPVDVFLDLSNDDLDDKFVGGDEEAEELERGTKSSSSVSSLEDDVYNSGAGDSASLTAGELPVPIDDLESLEWLSQFADDSVPELSFPCLAGDFKEKTEFSFPSRSEPASRPVVQRTPVFCFSSPVPAKARSKRSRSGGQAWSRGSPSVSESSSATVSSCLSSPTSIFSLWNPVHCMEFIDGAVKPPAKKQRKRPEAKTSEDASATQSQRRCSHCQVQKTPQWRAGPLGPKTLCNACGVRYKSGRLFPEYRPACSPTFSGEVHSNSHRKVLEMRRKKDVTGGEPGMTAMIRGC